jgi:ribosomal protein L31E
VADRLLTINLRNYLVRQPVRKRQMKISGYVRERVSHYLKVGEEKVRISGELNSLMTKRYSRSMLPLKVNVRIENGVATVSPFMQPEKAPAAAQKPEAKTKAAAAGPKAAAKSPETKKEAKPAAAER